MTLKLDDWTTQYIETALWSSNDEYSGNPLDSSYGLEDIAPEALTTMVDDCKRFREAAGELLYEHDDPTMGAHDFWLTRNGHGAGFWDGDWPENGNALTALSERFGEVDLYIGDDGLIYQS